MAQIIHRLVAPIPGREQAKKTQARRRRAVQQTPVEQQTQTSGIKRSDFANMPERAFAYLQKVDASQAFRSVLTDLATK